MPQLRTLNVKLHSRELKGNQNLHGDRDMSSRRYGHAVTRVSLYDLNGISALSY